MSKHCLSIPRVPPSYSQIIRMKVKDRIQLTITWRQEVRVAILEQLDLYDYKVGFKKIKIIQYRKRLIRDKENLWASVKPILDALKFNLLIIDDDMKHIDLKDVIQYRDAERTGVETIVEISD